MAGAGWLSLAGKQSGRL